MSAKHFSKGPNAHRGFILSYVLVGLAILSLSVMVVSRMANKTADANRMVSIRDELTNQIGLIRAKIVACTVIYAGGNNGLAYRVQFPITPTTGTISNATAGYVVDATCPGNNATGTAASIWSVSDGVYMPRSLPGMTNWTYTNDATSARIAMTATAGATVNAPALANAALRIGSQASMNTSTSTLTVTLAN